MHWIMSREITSKKESMVGNTSWVFRGLNNPWICVCVCVWGGSVPTSRGPNVPTSSTCKGPEFVYYTFSILAESARMVRGIYNAVDTYLPVSDGFCWWS